MRQLNTYCEYGCLPRNKCATLLRGDYREFALMIFVLLRLNAHIVDGDRVETWGVEGGTLGAEHSRIATNEQRIGELKGSVYIAKRSINCFEAVPLNKSDEPVANSAFAHPYASDVGVRPHERDVDRAQRRWIFPEVWIKCATILVNEDPKKFSYIELSMKL